MKAGPLEVYCRILLVLHERLLTGNVESDILPESLDKAWNRLGERERSLASEFSKSLANISHTIMRERSARPSTPPAVDDPDCQAVTVRLGRVTSLGRYGRRASASLDADRKNDILQSK